MCSERSSNLPFLIRPNGEVSCSMYKGAPALLLVSRGSRLI